MNLNGDPDPVCPKKLKSAMAITRKADTGLNDGQMAMAIDRLIEFVEDVDGWMRSFESQKALM
jgi:hypothetical protein